VQWFAAAHLRRETDLTSWEEVGKPDIQRWIAWLLDRYSSAYASDQYRALQQFFKWLAAEDEIPDPMAGLKPPRVPDKPVPVFAALDLPRLERVCAGRGFAQRRDAALNAVFEATGIRLSELAGIRYGLKITRAAVARFGRGWRRTRRSPRRPRQGRGGAGDGRRRR
jgi:site-specific recombinase XerC